MRMIPMEITCPARVEKILEVATPFVKAHFPEGQKKTVRYHIIQPQLAVSYIMLSPSTNQTNSSARQYSFRYNTRIVITVAWCVWIASMASQEWWVETTTLICISRK